MSSRRHPSKGGKHDEPEALRDLLGEVAEDLVDREAMAAWEQDLVEARRGGVVGYSARVFAQVGLPHKASDAHEYQRKNGNVTLSVWSPTGIPYGSVPRLILCYLATEAVRRKRPEIELGDSLSEFMGRVGLVATGGYIRRLRKQMERLFSASISVTKREPGGVQGKALTVASSYKLWWGVDDPRQRSLWESSVTLSSEFYNEIVSRPVPVDMQALRNLRQSPLALDIYVWMTHRMSYLSEPTKIPWRSLQDQFGSDYGRLDHFRTAAIRALAAVHKEYRQADFEVVPGGLELSPSNTHVRRGRYATRRIIEAHGPEDVAREVAPPAAPPMTEAEVIEILRLAQEDTGSPF